MSSSAPKPAKYNRSTLRLAAVLSAGLIVLAVAAPAQGATTVWVNQANGSCSDTGPGLGTPAKPYCSITAAINAHHAPGDSILVFPGVYREQVPGAGSGTSAAPISIVAVRSAGPVVVSAADDFANPAQWTRFSGNVWLAASVNWTPDQVFADSARLAQGSGSPGSLPAGSFLWQSGKGLYVNVGGDNPGIHHAEVGHRDYGFRISGSTQWLNIDGFAVTRCEDTGIFLNSNTSHISVTRDSVTYSFRYGIQSSGSSFALISSCSSAYHLWSGIALTAGATGCTVQDNESFGNLTPNQANGIYDNGAPNNLIQRNRLHDNAYNGIFMSSGATGNVMVQNRSWNNAHQGIEDIFCAGNTHVGDVSYHNGWNGFAIEGGATGTTVVDCIAIDNNTANLSGNANLEVDAQSTSGLVSNDNVFWNSAGGPIIYYAGQAYTTVSAFSAATGRDTRTRQADPRFVNRAAGDFHLLAGSPAIDNANSSVANWPATDAEGNARVDDPATPNTGIGPVTFADRGALEYQPPIIGPATVYVNASSASCSDAGPGTQAVPYCTISAALAIQHLPGSTIIVMPGIYREQVTLPASGASGNPITLQAQVSPGNPVVVDGADDFTDPALWTHISDDVWLAPSVTWSPAQVFADSARLTAFTGSPASLPRGTFMWVSGVGLYVNAGEDSPANHHAEVGHRPYGFSLPGVSWVVVDGFTTTRSESTGISLAGSSQITVTNDVAGFSNRHGIQADNCSAVVIGSCVTSNNNLNGIALTSGSTGCTVQDNESFGNLPAGQRIGICGFGAPNNLIQRNRVHDNDNGIVMSTGATGNVMLQNQSWNNAHHGFADTSSTANTHVGDVSYGNGWNGFAIDGGATGTTVVDCIATDNSRTPGYADLEVDASATSGLVSNDNVFWNTNGGVVVQHGGTSYTMVSAFSSATGLDTRTRQADPRFVNRTAGDFHLLPGSPAIDNANSSVAFWPSTDAAGNIRVDDPATANSGTGPVAYADRGALEYQPIAVSPTTVYVNASSASCSDGGSGSQATPFCTISTALAVQHLPGSTIIVMPGTYREQVTLPASGTSGSPITLQAQGSPGNPVVVDGADDFGNAALWTLHSGDVWLAPSVTWSPRQVFADSARLTASSGSPDTLPARSFVWVAGAGLYVNAGGGNPGDHHAEVGHRPFGFNVPGVSWVLIDGFTATQSESAGISLTNSSQITVTHDVATFSNDFGIKADNCSAVVIGSCVTSNHLWSGIALANGTNGSTVQDNESFGNLTTNHANGICGFGAANNLIQRNRVHDNAGNGILMSAGAANNVMLQNRSWNNARHGFGDFSSTGNTHVGDVSYGNGWHGFAIEGGATGTTVADCIATDNSRTAGHADLEVDTSSTSGLVSNDNVFWNTTGGAVVQYAGTSYDTVSAFTTATGLDTRTVQADPRFVNRAAGDFHLTAGSPAIDDANASVAHWPATDAEDSARVDDPSSPNNGIGPVLFADRGALEFHPAPLKTVYVNASSASCSDAGPGTQAMPYCTISGALLAHHAGGDSILVLPGIYREQVNASGTGQPATPISIVGRGATGSPVVVSGADDFADSSGWTPYAGNVWLAAGVTWSPVQVFADSARLSVSTGDPAALPAGSFVWVSGAGLYVNVGGDNPGNHHAEVGHRPYGFRLGGTQWFNVDGFAVTRAEDTGILFTSSTNHISITRDSVTYSGRYGIQSNGSPSALIGSCVTSYNLLSGIALTNGATGCTVQNNESHRNLTAGTSAGVYLLGAPGNVVKRNRLHDNAYTGLHVQGSDATASVQNRSWNNGDDGFHDVGSANVKHIGDVAFGNYRDGFGLDNGTTGATLGNCISTVNGLIGLGCDLMVDSVATTGLVSDDNLFWNPSGRTPVRYAGATYGTLTAYSAISGQDTRSIQADPRFTDPWNGDFRLTSGSPAIDNANSSVPLWPDSDACGAPRMDDPSTPNTGLGPVPYADRGALEYVPTLVPPEGDVPTFDHVIVVIMENQSYAAAKASPTIANLVASNASLAHDYAWVHPSQPNYFALWSGDTQGVVNDSCPAAGAPFNAENLGHACEVKGVSWRAYCENLPAPGSDTCSAGPSPTGSLYHRKHAPWVSFSNVNHDYELPYSQLALDIANNKLPRLAFVVPNNCDNGHDCPLDSTDAWLAREMPQMLSAVGANGLVVLTWDEDDDHSGNQVLTVMAGPLVRPGAVTQRFTNLYSLLRTLCVGLSLAPFGGAVAERPITDIWIPATGAVGPSGGGGAVSFGAWRPNPFHSATRIALTLPRPTVVAAEVYDVAGRRVWTMRPVSLVGTTEIRWDGSVAGGGRARPGIYLLKVRAGSDAFTRRVVRLE